MSLKLLIGVLVVVFFFDTYFGLTKRLKGPLGFILLQASYAHPIIGLKDVLNTFTGGDLKKRQQKQD